MMHYIFLDGNLLDGNLLDEFPFDSNLFVKDVKMMFLQVGSDGKEFQYVLEK